MMLYGLLASSAEASPIRQHRLAARGGPGVRAWSNFLSGGVALWSRRQAPTITGAVKRAMISALQSADPRSTPWVQYLLWRQGLNPARFNRYHPWLGPLLPELPTPTPPPTVPQTPEPPQPPAPEIIDPPSPEVPEPSTLLCALMLIGAGLVWQRRQSRIVAPAPA